MFRRRLASSRRSGGRHYFFQRGFAVGFGGIGQILHRLTLGHDLLRQFLGNGRVLLEKLLGVLAALAQTGTAVVDPGSTLLHQFLFDGQIEQVSFEADTAIIHQVEFGTAEGRSDLVLDHLRLDA